MCAHANLPEPSTADLVHEVVAGIPPCRVLSYGDVAALAGLGSGRIVGRVLAGATEPVPWHRVVRADGTCAPHLRARQLALLRAEGTQLRGERVVMAAARFDPTRLELPVAELTAGEAAGWLTSSLVPRPAVWVTTRSRGGDDEASPQSFVTVAATEPLTVCFSAAADGACVQNLRRAGEFVVCLATASMLQDLNESATPFPAGTNAFDEVGLGREPAAVVAASRVAGAPVVLECRTSGEHLVGDRVMVFGEVVHVAATRGLLAADGLPDPVVLAPLGRLGGDDWWRRGEVVRLAGIDWPSWQLGDRSAAPEPDPRSHPRTDAG